MQFVYTRRFQRSYRSATEGLQRAFDRKAALLLRDLRYPSLRAKKYDESRGIWQARIDRDWRFYFLIENDTYVLIRHDGTPKVASFCYRAVYSGYPACPAGVSLGSARSFI